MLPCRHGATTEILSKERVEAGAQVALLAKEKEATRARDALAAERRRQPRLEFSTDYELRGARRHRKTFLDLFEGRRS